MDETSKRRRQIARREAQLTGRDWESDRTRKRRLRAERRGTDDAAALVRAAAAFIFRDDKARGRFRSRVMRAHGDGDLPSRREREPAVVVYNESAARILG